ncbi:hypothetical protein BJX65DRAFT_48148 [Aspergillus insuetus]
MERSDNPVIMEGKFRTPYAPTRSSPRLRLRLESTSHLCVCRVVFPGKLGDLPFSRRIKPRTIANKENRESFNQPFMHACIPICSADYFDSTHNSQRQSLDNSRGFGNIKRKQRGTVGPHPTFLLMSLSSLSSSPLTSQACNVFLSFLLLSA